MLKAKAFGFATGIFAGVWWFVFMLISLSVGYGKDLIMMMGTLHPGFSYSYGGALWMGILHLIIGYILGYVFGWLYNQFAK